MNKINHQVHYPNQQKRRKEKKIDLKIEVLRKFKWNNSILILLYLRAQTNVRNICMTEVQYKYINLRCWLIKENHRGIVYKLKRNGQSL